MNKLDIMKELLNNTKLIPEAYGLFYEMRLLQDSISISSGCIEGKDILPYKDVLYFNRTIRFIEEQGFDMTGWTLRNSNEEGTFTFWNPKRDEWFDILIWTLNEVYILYCDENYNQQEVASIEEAIRKYVK